MNSAHRILALDIGSSSLKLAEFRALKGGGVELVKFGVASMGLDPQADSDRSAYVTATIRELMEENGIKPGPVVVSVSGQAVFSRFVKLPPVDSEKVYQIIQYEAQQNVPFPMHEVVWDYQLIAGTAEGEVDVMLAAIKAELIEELTEAVEATGLRVDLVDVAPMTLYNTVRYTYGEMEGCTLVVDIGARSTDLIFIEGHRVFIRSVPVAGNAITQQLMQEFECSFQDAQEMKHAHAFVSFGPAFEKPTSEVADRVSKSARSVMTRMHAEINRSINFYRSQQGGSKPSRILVAGGSSVIAHTDTFLREKLGVDVDYLNPFQNVSVSEGIASEVVARHAHELGEVVGLGLRRVLTCPIEINLMPPRMLADRAFRAKEPLLVVGAALLVLTLGVWCAYFFRMSQLTQVRLEKVQQRLTVMGSYETRLKRAEREVGEVEADINTLRALSTGRSEWLGILDEIHQLLPDGMWLTRITSLRDEARTRADRSSSSLAREGGESTGPLTRIELEGLAWTDKVGDTGPLITFRDGLRASPLFSDQTTISWSPAPGMGEVTRNYRITVYLEQPIQQ